MEALPLPPLLPRPREEDVVEVDGRDCTGILELSAEDITTHAQARDGAGGTGRTFGR